MTYFDHNATTPLSAAAREAWLEAADQFPANPSSPHRLGARAEAALSEAREKLARMLGCEPFDLIWTSGATESNNTVLHHYTRTRPELKEVWVSAIEHPCVLIPAQHYFGSKLRRIPVSHDGVVDLNWIEKQLSKRRPALIAVMAANNETGVIQPWQSVLQLCREWEVAFFCDAAQWIGKLPARSIGQCDWVSGCAHKFGGPKGVGFLKCPSKGAILPLIFGGEQESGRRSGTENVAGVVGMIAALEECEALLSKKAHETRSTWRARFETHLLKRLPGCSIVDIKQPRLWNTVAALMPQADCQQRWVVKLDKAGFAVSTGSACASGKEEASHVLSAMGFAAEESSRMLRFSSGWQTRQEEWDALGDAILQVQGEMATG
ncbi:MAG TPA: cysteine desulfurase family protein [Verrucomicrobiae bacterium]|nr:cysteine desulfurase family protein [Verrucomicrobiae bacterium]